MPKLHRSGALVLLSLRLLLLHVRVCVVCVCFNNTACMPKRKRSGVVVLLSLLHRVECVLTCYSGIVAAFALATVPFALSADGYVSHYDMPQACDSQVSDTWCCSA